MCLRVLIDAPDGTCLEGTVPYGTDFDQRFRLTDDDGQHWWINGWLCSVEILNDHSLCKLLPLGFGGVDAV